MEKAQPKGQRNDYKKNFKYSSFAGTGKRLRAPPAWAASLRSLPDGHGAAYDGNVPASVCTRTAHAAVPTIHLLSVRQYDQVLL
jgi:hypothetical protein